MYAQECSKEWGNAKECQHFLEGTVHTFRARLRDIATSAALFRRKGMERHEEEDCVNRILRSVSELDRFTKSLTEYAYALGDPKFTCPGPMPVENALAVALSNLGPRIQETGASIYTGPMPRMQADHEKLGVLFRCLLSNAVEYTRANVPARVEVTATPAAEEWRFAVSDNGIGIAPQFHRKVFEPFERLDGGNGFGLGLAIARKIVNSHGGRLWLDSQEGEGSTFFFTLPVTSPAGA